MPTYVAKFTGAILRFFQAALNRPSDSEDELYFCTEFMKQRNIAHAEVAFKVGLYCHFVAMAVIPFVAHQLSMRILFGAHAAFAVFSLWAVFPGRIQKSLVPRLLPLLLLAPGLVYAYITKMFVDAGIPDHVLLASTGFIIISNFAILLYAGRLTVHLGMVALLITVGYFITKDLGAGKVWASIYALSAVGSLIVSYFLDRRHWDLSRREYKLLIQAAPAKIVRQSINTGTILAEAFSPKHRHCVCISSDWRGYQKLTVDLAADQLATALGNYYELCNSLLEKHFKEGNFYTDWIADELFVVIFAKDVTEEKALVNQALAFSWELILAKRDFMEKFGIPDAIDIGISAGLAMIGMMGPVGHKKATALGDVPGRARRYQSTGKLLRARLGEVDRVLFGVESLMEISMPLDIQEFKVEGTMRLRDLDTSSIYYMEPDHRLAA